MGIEWPQYDRGKVRRNVRTCISRLLYDLVDSQRMLGFIDEVQELGRIRRRQ